MILAQITDLHIAAGDRLVLGRFDTAACLARCLQSIAAAAPRPDLVLASGDLVERGEPQEYRRLRECLTALPVPVYLMPGNHDDREALRAAFPDHGYLPAGAGAPLNYIIDDHAVRVIALDTLVPGQGGGALDDAQTDWLEEQLAAAPRRPVILAMHHPPFRTGIQRMDELGFEADSAARLGALLVRHRQVALIVCGHVHRSIQTQWHGVAVSVCPSSAFQYGLRLVGGGLAPALDEPPGYQLHCWNGSSLVTHTVAVVNHTG